VAAPAPDAYYSLGRKEIKRVRARFLALRDHRRERIRVSLQREQLQFLELLPLLFHVNHPLLPGFVHTETPAGVADYVPGRNVRLLAKRHARSFRLQRRAVRRYPVRGIYLMGSLGSLGQEAASDFDIWLCYDAGLQEEHLTTLLEKAAGIEEWGKTLGLQVFIFPMQAEAFRDGRTLPLSEESSGGLGRHLLLEEFYRTGILLAGLAPLWWLVPPERDIEYTEYTQRLFKQRFVSPNAWLDFGGMDQVPSHAFFEAAHWQLHKSIVSPYKALLKLMLFETYAAQYPNVRWVSHRIKQAVYAEPTPDADALDPYRLVLDRITEHLDGPGEHERMELARRAFYVKAGQALTRPTTRSDWKRDQMLALVRDWGWSLGDLRRMDSRHNWKLDEVTRERNAQVAELSRGYRMLTGFATQEPDSGSQYARELSLLGRQLYAAMERRSGKIERINPGISLDLSEPKFWLRRKHDLEGERWLLGRQSNDGKAQRTTVKATRSMLEMLAWMHVNGLAHPGTPLHFEPAPEGTGTPHYVRVMRILARHLPRRDMTPRKLEAFVHNPTVDTSLVFVGVGLPERQTRIHWQIDHLLINSWGEILVERHVGGMGVLLDTLCRHLDMLPRRRCAQREPVFRTFSFSAGTIRNFASQLDKLARDVWQCIQEMGSRARYLTQLNDRLYLIERREESNGLRFRWSELGSKGDMLALLGRPCTPFRPTRVDAKVLPGSPLPDLLRLNRPGVVQVFYRLDPLGINMWALDDQGALFDQHLPQAREEHFLVHQQRFFDHLQSRQLLLPNENDNHPVPLAVTIQQVVHDGRTWQFRDAAIATKTTVGSLDLILVAAPTDQAGVGHTLLCGAHEFDSLMLGQQFFETVANHVLGLREDRERYPIYITAIQPAGLGVSENWSIAGLLRLKRRLEHQLNAAIGLSGPRDAN